MRLRKSISSLLMLMLMMGAGLPSFAQSDYDSDLVLFVNEDSLTIYVAYPDPVSLKGFQFRVVENGGAVALSPEIRFDVLTLYDYILPGSTCLIYQYNAAEPNSLCDSTNTFISRVGPGDRFWYDDNNMRRTLTVTRDGVTTYQSCADSNTTCPIYYSIPKPEINDASDIRPFVPPETVVEPIYSETNLLSNRGSITHITWSPDGSELISGHANGDICLWDPKNSAATSYVTCADSAHTNGVTAVAWNPDRLEIASAGGDGVVNIWKIETSPTARITLMNTLRHTAPVDDISWHPSEPKLATVSDDRLLIWDIDNAQVTQSFIINNPDLVEWRDDGKYLLVLSAGNILRVVDSTEQSEYTILKIYPSDVSGQDAAWQPNFGDLASLTSNGTVELFAYRPGIVCPNSNCSSIALAQNLVDASEIKFSPDGNLIAIAMRGEVDIMEAREPYQLVNKFAVRDHTDSVFTSIAWSADGLRLAGADNQGGIHIWSVTKQQSSQRLEQVERWLVSTKGALAMAWHPNGGGLAVVDYDLQLSIWERSGKKVGRSVAHTELPLAIDWNDSQQVIGTGGCGPTGTIWGLNAVALIIMDVDFGTTNCVTALGFNPSGTVVAMADESGILRIWDWAANPPATLRVKQLRMAVNDIGWDVSGSRLASVDDAGSITVFDMVNYQTKAIFTRQPNPGTPVNALAWTPYDEHTSANGESLATASSAGWIAIWHMQGANPQPDTPFDGSYLLEGHHSPVVSLSWSPNHNWLVSVSEDRHIIIWDALTGQRLAQQILDAVPSDISWSPIGASFAVTDLNGYVTLFDFHY